MSDEFNHSEIWTVDGQLITILKDIQILTYSPDGHFLVGKQYINDYDEEIILFDIQNNFEPKPLITYNKLYNIRFDADGARFITFGCTDGQSWESGFFCYGGTATIWDKDGNFVAELNGLDEVTEAGFMPNSDNTITAGCDGIVEYSRAIPNYDCLSSSLRLHDKDGATIAILRDEIRDFWISPDGNSFVTTSHRYFGKAKLWKLLP